MFSCTKLSMFVENHKMNASWRGVQNRAFFNIHLCVLDTFSVSCKTIKKVIE